MVNRSIIKPDVN